MTQTRKEEARTQKQNGEHETFSASVMLCIMELLARKSQN